MFWYLLFAHLLADYALQNTWMVIRKTKFSILLLHIAIHYGTLLLVVGKARQLIWPYLLILVLFHLSLDLAKNLLNKARPEWVIAPYIFDQVLHSISIWVAAAWIESRFNNLALPFSRTVFVYASVYFLVTYVWYISERIFAHSDAAYRQEVVEQIWVRMISRAAFLSGFLVFLRWIMPQTLSSTLAFSIPYSRSKNGFKALFTDLGVSVAGLILIISAI